MKNKVLRIIYCIIFIVCSLQILNIDFSFIVNFMASLFTQHKQLFVNGSCEAITINSLEQPIKNIEEDLILIKALNKDPDTSLAEKKGMAQALIEDLETLRAQNNVSKKKIKAKKKFGKKSVQSIGAVQKSLTPDQARRAIEIITADMIDMNNTKSLDEHLTEMMNLSECLDSRVKADVAAKKAVEYIKDNKYLLTKDLSIREKVVKGPFVLSAYNALPKSQQFVDLYEEDFELFTKILQSKDLMNN